MNKGCFSDPFQNENDAEHSELIFAILKHKKHVRIFIEESQVSLASISSLLKNRTDIIDTAEIFRKIHTLKGSASVLSFEKMITACESAEDFLQKFKIAKNKSTLDALQKKCLQIEVALKFFTTCCKDILGKEAISSEKKINVPISQFEGVLKKIPVGLSKSQLEDYFTSEFMMEPIGSFFEIYNDLLCKTAKEQKKLIKSVKLENHELKVLHQAYAPLFSTLIHALRNSLDHGIEPTEVRTKIGKPLEGSIKILFSLVGKNLCIQIKDDGNGIDAKKLRALLQKEGINTIHHTDEQVLQHIFDIYYTSNENITEISGRGVGLNAIKTAAEAMGGKVWVTSIFHQETNIFIEVPYITNLRNIQESRAA